MHHYYKNPLPNDQGTIHPFELTLSEGIAFRWVYSGLAPQAMLVLFELLCVHWVGHCRWLGDVHHFGHHQKANSNLDPMNEVEKQSNLEKVVGGKILPCLCLMITLLEVCPSWIAPLEMYLRATV